MSETPPRTKRHQGPDFENLSKAQSDVHQQILNGPRGNVIGPLRIWLSNPDMAQKAQSLGQYARYETKLPPDKSELAILVTARYWSSGFEWVQHVPFAREAGISTDVIDALGQGRRPSFTDTASRLVFEVSVQLHRDKRINDVTYSKASAVLGAEALIDLVTICGYYTLISMTINAFEVPDGTGDALPSIDLAPHEMFLN